VPATAPRGITVAAREGVEPHDDPKARRPAEATHSFIWNLMEKGSGARPCVEARRNLFYFAKKEKQEHETRETHMSLLQQTLSAIHPADRSLEPAIQAHLNDLTKPQGSLGRLESLALQYCLAAHTLQPKAGLLRVYCFAGDHGVASEGVSAFPKEVTPQMVGNMLAGGAAINVFARHVGAELRVVDMGVDADLHGAPGLIHRKIARGTANIAVGPAMRRDQAIQALEAGIGLAMEAARDNVTLLGTGEMGIANTTPATALLSAYLGCPPVEITGRGTGVDDARLQNKIQVIERALAVNRGRIADPLDALAALGGFEIAGIAGLVLGGAAAHIPVVVDGFISTAGALAALRIQPAVADYVFFSHLSAEQGHRRIMKELSVKPILDLDMRLGEGTGAALAMSILAASLKMYNEMATFSGARVSTRETP
jgi:nicotinate-nucleotide--dimethylbenzimidazole phosphoribosyltransferase